VGRVRCEVCRAETGGARRQACGECERKFGPCCRGDEFSCTECYEKGHHIRSAHSANHQ
jgi:hypothetical protein